MLSSRGRSTTGDLDYAQLINSLFPRLLPGEEKRLLMLSGFIDESGTHRSSPVTTVAGVFTDVDKGITLRDAWADAVENWKIPFFHMTDFENRVGPYQAWTEAERHDRLNHLLDLFQQHVMGTVAVSIRTDVFDALMDRVNARRLGGVYGTAMILLTAEAALLFGGYPGSAADHYIAYVAEGGAEGAGQIGEGYLALLNSPVAERYRMTSFTFGSKRQFTPLQAADLLAYEVYKDMRNYVEGSGRPRRYPLEQLARQGNRRWIEVAPETIVGLDRSASTWLRAP